MQDRYNRLVIIAAVLLAGVFGALYLLVQIPRKIVARGMKAAVEKEEKAADLGSIVTQIRQMSRLETASMRVMNVGKVEQSYGIIPDKLAGDAITFLAVGEVIAGVDLSRITRDDVRLEGDGALVVRLPEAQIFVSRLDNRESRVIDRDTGLLRGADVDLESRAREAGETSIRREAMNKGIIRIASANAEARLASFLNTVGFRKVRFESPGGRSLESSSGIR